MDRDAAQKQAEPDAARKARRKRADNAWTRRDEWQKVMADAYDFVAPHRLSNRWTQSTPSTRTRRMFDNTASVAWMRATGRLQHDLFPPGEPWGKLEPGPAAAALGMNLDDARRELRIIDDQVDPVFLDGDFDMSMHETLSDFMISAGCMLILKGHIEKPVNFVNMAFDEVAMDLGPFNAIWGLFWKRKWGRRELYEAYPRGKFSQCFMEKMNVDGEEKVTVAFDILYEQKSRLWKLYIYLHGEEEEDVWVETSREAPFIAPRYFRLPGEVYGMGPVLLNLPTTKTLNKAIEITLKSSALAMLGIYTRIDDGVFNPDTARLEPGAMWPVARNGGPLGPSIQRLQTSYDPNLANMSIQDMRMMTQAGYNDQQLPPDGSSPRSAAEIIERVKRMGQDHAGAYGRIIHEIVLPVRRRVMEVLWEMGVLKTRIKIDQLLVQMRVVSPLGSAYKARRALDYVNWVMATEGIEKGLAHVVTPVDEGMKQVGHDLGIDPRLIYTKEESAQAAKNIQQKTAAALAAQKPAAAPAPPNGDPAQAMAA